MAPATPIELADEPRQQAIELNRELEAIVGGWIKDPQQLQTALAALAQRKATVTQLAAACATLAQPQP